MAKERTDSFATDGDGPSFKSYFSGGISTATSSREIKATRLPMTPTPLMLPAHEGDLTEIQVKAQMSPAGSIY